MGKLHHLRQPLLNTVENFVLFCFVLKKGNSGGQCTSFEQMKLTLAPSITVIANHALDKFSQWFESCYT